MNCCLFYYNKNGLPVVSFQTILSCSSVFVTDFSILNPYNRYTGGERMPVIYIDCVFLLNLAIDYLLLLCTARLAGAPLQRLRLALCSALGALYSVLVFLPWGSRLADMPIKIAVGILMACLAFRPVARCWRLVALFFLLSGALAGLLLALGLALGHPGVLFSRLYYAKISWPILLISASVMMVLIHLIFRQGARHGGGELMTVIISIHHKERRITALLDTGNTLREPVSGRPVLVSDRSALCDLWPPDIASIIKSSESPEEKMVRLYDMNAGDGFSLLPFRSVGSPSGLLLAARSDYIKVGEKRYPRALVALAEGPLSDGGGYSALWGGIDREGGSRNASFKKNKVLDHQTQQAG